MQTIFPYCEKRYQILTIKVKIFETHPFITIINLQQQKNGRRVKTKAAIQYHDTSHHKFRVIPPVSEFTYK